MSRKLLAALAATTVTVPLLLAGPSALAAAPTSQAVDSRPSVRTVSDPRGDVWFGTENGDKRRVAHRRIGDLTSFRVAHQRNGVHLRLTMARMKKPAFLASGTVMLKGPNGKRYVAAAFTSVLNDTPRGDHGLWGPGDRKVRCPGMTHRLDYRKGVITMFVPRSCLGSPRWVRARAATYWSGAEKAYIDIAPGRSASENGPWLPRAWRQAS
ncbi:hypothetical protein [Nocardioides speluncae]|uniref:hypothetical protein n=1 Tax=Nocardioides speluncae TaxID=2670337 RepID=UPI0012B16D83|nr:hypothetical protein [Nocardioides speluncae]